MTARRHLQAMTEDVRPTLHQHDQERLDGLAGVRKDQAVWEHQRKYERSTHKYLGEDVLKDTGSAVVWWLAKNDEQVERTVEDLGMLARLTSAVNDTDVPERLRALIHNAISGGVQHGPVIQSGRIAGLTFHVHGPGLPVQD